MEDHALPAPHNRPIPDAPFLLWTDVSLHPAALDTLRGQVALAGPGVAPTDAADPSFEFETADAAIVSTRRTYNAAAFARAPRLKVIARSGIGYDNVDVAAASAAGICAVNTPAAPTESTAEFAVGLMFAVARRIVTVDHGAKSGFLSSKSAVTESGADLG